MTDVNIAVQLLNDAQDDSFDTALIISADSDLTPVVETVLQRYPKKRVVLAFPPNRSSSQLKVVGSASFTIGRKILKDSQFPNQVMKKNGFKLKKPSKWNQ